VAANDASRSVAGTSGGRVVVRTPEAARLLRLLSDPGVSITSHGPDPYDSGVIIVSHEPDRLEIRGLTCEQIGYVAWQYNLPIYELAPATEPVRLEGDADQTR
jgi:hypothetical protein